MQTALGRFKIEDNKFYGERNGNYKHSIYKVEEARRLFKDGYTVSEIMEELDVPSGTVSNWVRNQTRI